MDEMKLMRGEGFTLSTLLFCTIYAVEVQIYANENDINVYAVSLVAPSVITFEYYFLFILKILRLGFYNDK